MIRLSTKGRYGVMAMFALSRSYEEGPRSVRRIAEEQDIPPAYLEQIMARLRHEGLVESARGRGGGYRLARPPERITIGDVIRAVEGPIALSNCLTASVPLCDRVDGCVTRLIWKRLGQRIERAFDAITLERLCRSGGEELSSSISSSSSSVM